MGFRICWRKPFFCIMLYPLKSAKALVIIAIFKIKAHIRRSGTSRNNQR